MPPRSWRAAPGGVDIRWMGGARLSAMNEAETGGSRRRWGWRVDRTWEGASLDEEQISLVTLAFRGAVAEIMVDAPYHGDPAPGSPQGRCEGLWNHEVVEFFMCGDDERYVEVECGPHGHFLVLELHGSRNLVRDDVPVVDYASSIDGGRWQATLQVEMSWLPPGIRVANAYRIAGQGEARSYAAAFPGSGAPDFHRLELFRPLSEAAVD